MKYEEKIKKLTPMEKASIVATSDFRHSEDLTGIHNLEITDFDTMRGKIPNLPLIAQTFDMPLIKSVGEVISSTAKSLDYHLVSFKANLKRFGNEINLVSEDPYFSGLFFRNLISNMNYAYAMLDGFIFSHTYKEPEISDMTIHEAYLMPYEMSFDLTNLKAISFNGVNTHGLDISSTSSLISYIPSDNLILFTKGYDLNDGFIKINSRSIIMSNHEMYEKTLKGIENYNEYKKQVKNGNVKNEEMIQYIDSGKICDESQIDETIDRYLDILLTSKGSSALDTNDIISAIYDEAFVLLSNDGILPIKEKASIGFLGQAETITKFDIDQIKTSFSKYGFNVLGYEDGYKLGELNKSILNKSLDFSKKCDYVLLFLNLTDEQNPGVVELINKLKALDIKVIVALNSNYVLDMTPFDKANALIKFEGMSSLSYEALARMICGKVNPSGRLLQSYPLDIKNSLPKSLDWSYSENIDLGYANYLRNNIPMKYPFGYGLSYSKFSYSDIRYLDNKVYVKVKNDSNIDGFETLFVFVKNKESKVLHDMPHLVGFKKEMVYQNDEKEFEIELSDKAFMYYSKETKKYECEGGTFTILVGKNPTDIILTLDVLKEPTIEVKEILRNEVAKKPIDSSLYEEPMIEDKNNMQNEMLKRISKNNEAVVDEFIEDEKINKDANLYQINSLKELSKDIYEYFISRGIKVKEDTISNFLAVMSSTKTIVTYDDKANNCHTFLRILGAYFGSKLYKQDASQLDLYFLPFVDSYLKTELTKALISSYQNSNKFNFIVFDNASSANLCEKIKNLYSYLKAPKKEWDLNIENLDKDPDLDYSSLKTKNNLWTVFILDRNEEFVPSYLADIAQSFDFDILEINEIALDPKNSVPSVSSFNEIVSGLDSETSSFYLEEEDWKKLDRFIDSINSEVAFKMTNHTEAIIDCYSSCYKALGLDNSLLLDEIISSVLVLRFKSIKSLSKGNISEISNQVDEILTPEFNIKSKLKLNENLNED